MSCRRIRQRWFLLGSLSFMGIFLGLWFVAEQAWLAHLSPGLRQTLCLATSLTASLVVILWASLMLSKSTRQGESTETKFRTLLECAPDALIIMDREGRIVLVNRRAEEMFGYQRGELLGKPAEQLVRKQTRAILRDQSMPEFTVTTGTQDSSQPEALGYHKDGRSIPVEVRFSPLESQDGLLVISIVRDISERIRRERRRIARQATRRVLGEAISLEAAAPSLLQTACDYLEWDLGILWTAEGQTGQFPCLDSWHKATRRPVDLQWLHQGPGAARDEALLQEVLKSGKPRWLPGGTQDGQGSRTEAPVPARFYGAFGIPIVCDQRIVGVLGFFTQAGGEPDEHLQETLTSISNQVAQFMQRRQAEEAMCESEARKAAILEASLDGIITIDHEGKIVEFNPAAESMFGYTRSQVLHRELAELVIPAQQQGIYREALGRSVTSAACGTLGKRLEVSARRADGTEFPVEVAITRIQAKGLPMFTGHVRDLSERKQAEETLRQTEERFRQAQKMEAIGRLAGGVAHDFNNLLTVITGYTDLLLGGLADDDPSKSLLQETAKAAQRASMLTRQLLAFSRKHVLTAKVLDLNSVVTDMDKMLRRLIGEDINLVSVLAPDLHPIKADPGQIEQVIMNLAVNARDAIPHGGTLTLETANVELDDSYTCDFPELQPGRYVLLAVSDTGCGMDETVKARLFEPFFTTKEVGKGTGLGLATVYGIVKQGGGHVAVYSELSKGTTFKIYLPYASEPVTAPEGAAPRAAPTGTETVLVVEDEDGVRALTSRVLKKNGYKVLEARHGLEALEVCAEQTQPVNLIVTDVVMPKMNGPQLAERIRGQRPDLPVLFLSGYTDRALMHNGLLDGNRNFLQKPFTPDDLANKVREMLSA